MSIKLESSDEQVFEVPREVAEMSLTIKNMLADIDSPSTDSIPLSITGNLLAKVVEWATYHHANPPPVVNESEPKKKLTKEEEAKEKRKILPWDKEFCDVDQATLFQLMMAANYLDIKALLELTCKTVANMINGKAPDEIRALFNIKNDLTPEDEEKMRQDYGWSLDNLKKEE